MHHDYCMKGHVKEHENDQTVQEVVNKQTADLKVITSTYTVY